MNILSMTRPLLSYRINLPFPVSVNRIWRHTRGVRHTRAGTQLSLPRMMRSVEYRAWIEEADEVWLTQKRQLMPIVMIGHYTSHMIFDVRRRRILDGENLLKGVSDWLQHVGVIHNDSLAEGGSWVWGESDGCTVEVRGVAHDATQGPQAREDQRLQSLRQSRRQEGRSGSAAASHDDRRHGVLGR